MRLYRGWRGGGGGALCPSLPWLPWIRVCRRIMPLCVSVEFLCLSVYQSVCLSKSLYVYDCQSVCISLSLSLSLPLSLSQHMLCKPCRPGILSLIPGNSRLYGTLNQSCSQLSLAGRSPFSLIMHHLSVTTTSSG